MPSYAPCHLSDDEASPSAAYAAAARAHNGDPKRGWRYLQNHQGLYILNALSKESMEAWVEALQPQVTHLSALLCIGRGSQRAL